MSDDPQRPEAGLAPELSAALAEVGALRAQLEDERRKRTKLKKKHKSGVGTDRGVETMFRTSYRTHMDLSSLADTKANIMISINGIIISILLASVAPMLSSDRTLLAPTAVLLLGCLISIVYAVLAARPRVSSHVTTLDDVRSGGANILFFGNFVSLSQDEYVEGMRELMQDTEEVYMNMVRDIHSLGLVLSKKFKLLRVSYNVFMTGLVLGVLSFLISIAFSPGAPPLP